MLPRDMVVALTSGNFENKRPHVMFTVLKYIILAVMKPRRKKANY